jgi:phage gp45-like
LDPLAEIHEILCFARSRHIHHPPKRNIAPLRRAQQQVLGRGLVAVQGRAKPQGAIQSWLLHQMSFEDVKKMNNKLQY